MTIPAVPWTWTELVVAQHTIRTGTHICDETDGKTYVVVKMYSYTDDVNVMIEDDSGDGHWLVAKWDDVEEAFTTWEWYDEATMESTDATIIVVGNA